MKKLIGVMSAAIAVVGLTACGGEEQPVEESKAAEVVEEQVVESETVTKEFGNISIDVPSKFTDVTLEEDFYVVGGPNASITVTSLPEVELLPSEWDESLASESLELFFSETYSNMELAIYEGSININGNPAVYYSFYGTNADGDEHLVHIVRLFNADISKQYLVNYIHLVEDESYTADVSSAIIDSIVLTEK